LLPGFGIHGDYGLCDFDITKVFHFSGTYELPAGSKKRFLANSGKIVDAVLGGGKQTGFLPSGGQPFTFTA